MGFKTLSLLSPVLGGPRERERALLKFLKVPDKLSLPPRDLLQPIVSCPVQPALPGPPPSANWLHSGVQIHPLPSMRTVAAPTEDHKRVLDYCDEDGMDLGDNYEEGAAGKELRGCRCTLHIPR